MSDLPERGKESPLIIDMCIENAPPAPPPSHARPAHTLLTTTAHAQSLAMQMGGACFGVKG